MNDIDHTEIIELLESRAAIYRFLAQMYFQPLSQEQIEALAGIDLAGLVAGASPLVAGCDNLRRALRLRHTGTKEELAADYTGAFYGIRTVGGRTAQPFESLFESEKSNLMGEARSEVYRELRAAGLRVSEGVDLPEDHLSFICEYLAYLCDEMIEALRSEAIDRAKVVLGHQRAFFQDHLASWFPAFRVVADQLVETRFYRGVLDLTEAFVAAEFANLNELKALLR